MSDADLFTWSPPPPAAAAFDGDSYEPERDHKRLAGQLGNVFKLMSDGAWRTLAEISTTVGGSEAAVSARLRDLRKSRYGANIVNRRRIGGGLYEYQLEVNSAVDRRAEGVPAEDAKQHENQERVTDIAEAAIVARPNNGAEHGRNQH